MFVMPHSVEIAFLFNIVIFQTFAARTRTNITGLGFATN